MDTSTKTQCAENVVRVEDPPVYTLTGKRLERFSGPQIRKFYQTEPESHHNTSDICLQVHLSQVFWQEILLGLIRDASGTNLMNIQKTVGPKSFSATAPDLLNKLQPVSNPQKPVGVITFISVQDMDLTLTALFYLSQVTTRVV